MKREGLELIVSIMLMFFSGFPLIEILSKGLIIDQISKFSLGIIVGWLIIILVSSFIYFVSYWMEKFDQLHFKGAVYTVPKIYQVRGLHNSSSLYKITKTREDSLYNPLALYKAVGWGMLKSPTWHTGIQFYLDLQLSRLEQQTHNLEVLGSSPSWSTIDDSVNL